MMMMMMRIMWRPCLLHLSCSARRRRAPDTVSSEAARFTVEEVATGLEHPWGLAVLDDGRMVTEKPGRLRMIGKDGKVGPPIKGVPEVDSRGQGGLLDMPPSTRSLRATD